MSIEAQPFGVLPDGRPVLLFRFINANGLRAAVTNYGAILVSLRAPDRDGKLDEINVGFDTLAEYLGPHPYFGATIGRFANRIDAGRFTLDGKTWPLAINEPGSNNHLHGGNVGFDKVLWDARVESGTLVLRYLSPDGDEGYPGALDTTVSYTLTDDNELIMTFLATTDRPTIVTLTNHAYWNLAGVGNGPIHDHELQVAADLYLEKRDRSLPSGKIVPVDGTPVDFRAPRRIGERLAQLERGYDHCFALRVGRGELGPAAIVYDPATGRVMEVRTTQPGVQLYTAGFSSRMRCAGGRVIDQYHAFCLECQHYPNAPNVPEFPSTVLRPGETYGHRTVHKFSAR